jgi:hypothetical protein
MLDAADREIFDGELDRHHTPNRGITPGVLKGAKATM